MEFFTRYYVNDVLIFEWYVCYYCLFCLYSSFVRKIKFRLKGDLVFLAFSSFFSPASSHVGGSPFVNSTPQTMNGAGDVQVRWPNDEKHAPRRRYARTHADMLADGDPAPVEAESIVYVDRMCVPVKHVCAK